MALLPFTVIFNPSRRTLIFDLPMMRASRSFSQALRLLSPGGSKSLP